MKKRFIVLLLIILLSTFVLAQEDNGFFEEEEGEGETEYTSEDLNSLPEDSGVIIKEESYNFEEMSYDSITVNEVPPTSTIQTTQGSFSNYQMTNALFTLGTLAQASLVSFENNNNLFFGSIFDGSIFELTLDEEGEAQVTQRNSMGDMGRVYISTDGNLTQDNTVVFIPDGDNPTYIYYNTTEVEFEDGTVYLGNEQLTNKDDTKESSTLEFNENGFTRIQIQPENNYTIGTLKFINNERESIWACKQDTTCEININKETGAYTITGEIDIYDEEILFINSLDSNNIINYHSESHQLTFTNTKAKNGNDLVIINTGNYRITETREDVYEFPINEGYKSLITTYSSELNNRELTIKGEILTSGDYTAYEE